jgi:uncharacterized protein YydD (DUF2326 family)
MFLKTLTISAGSEIIREIRFRKGINLIVDESEGKVTGNSVGKTTVLKLIDFCLGGDAKKIYEDPESKKVYTLVRDFLVEKEVLITLCLTESLDNGQAPEVFIERNFLLRNKAIRRINDDNFTTEDDFKFQLLHLFFPEQTAPKPSFRQIISHNIRYEDLNINNTLKTLDSYTSDAEYETLYLFLFGCNFTQGFKKQEILLKIQQEDTFKRRLEKQQTKSAYEAALSLIENEIVVLNRKKAGLNINEHFEADLEKLNQLKYSINKLSSEISRLNIRKGLIVDTGKELEAGAFDMDLQQLRLIYEQATNKISGIQKTFEDLVHYHNQMIIEKTKFITKELPALETKIETKNQELNGLLKDETALTLLISKSDSFEELESLINELNEKYRCKGEYESIIQQLNDVDKNIKNFNEDLQTIDSELFSDEFEATVKLQLNKFNRYFASASESLYGEQYALKHDKIKNQKGQLLYKFSAFNTNIGSGKKQGEISCFDIAYTFFADEEKIPCMHFLLNDKKELMHDNQLVKIARLANSSNIQFVASILKDKLPDELNVEDYFVLKLSDDEKLFRIEQRKSPGVIQSL